MNSQTDPYISRLRRSLALLVLAIGVGLAIAWWVGRGQAVQLVDAGDVRLDCVSYAPFRKPGETPFDPNARVSPQRIEQDLRILRERSDCVRTYAVQQGLEMVPRVARGLGMRVKLGAWIGRDPAANALELVRALELAREYRDVIELLIVGNEVLLRGDLEPPALAALLARARAASAVPVSYADVWEFWLRNDGLRAQVDVVTVHILPYWEDEPVAVNLAVDHVFAIAAKVTQHFAGTPVLVGETGWPSAGRQRAGAVPGRLNQARFAREFVARANRDGLSYNFIEGFDQPWKRRLEGAMGGFWGLFDSDGVPNFPWTGAIEDDPTWWRGPSSAAVAGVAGFLVGARRRRGAAAGGATALAWAASAALGVAHLDYMTAWYRTPLEWVIGAVVAMAALACVLTGAQRLTALMSAQSPGPGPRQAAPGVVRALRESGLPARAFALSRAAVLVAAAAIALALAVDPRYRGFPCALFAPPALVLLSLCVAGDRQDADARVERLLAAVIAACAAAIVWIEGAQNAQALGFAAVLLMLAATTAGPYRSAAPRAGTRTPRSAAGANGSTG